MSRRIAMCMVALCAASPAFLACGLGRAQSTDSAPSAAQQIGELAGGAMQAARQHDNAQAAQLLDKIFALADANHLGGDPSFHRTLFLVGMVSSDPQRQLAYFERAVRLSARDGDADSVKNVCEAAVGTEVTQLMAARKGPAALDDLEVKFPSCREMLERLRQPLTAMAGVQKGDYTGLRDEMRQRSEAAASAANPAPDATGLAFMSLLSGDVEGARRYVLKMEDDPKTRDENGNLPGLPELRELDNSGSGSGFGAASIAVLYHLRFKQEDREVRQNAMQLLLSMKDRELDEARLDVDLLRTAQTLKQSDLASRMIAEYRYSSSLWAEAMMDRGSVSDAEEHAGVARMQALERDLRGLERKDRADVPPLRSPRVADVQQALKPDEALVEYAEVWWPNYHQGAKPPIDLKRVSKELHYVAYVLRHDGMVSGFDLGDAAAIQEAIKSYRSLASSRTPKDRLSDSAHALHRLLWKPLLSALGGADSALGHVYVSPDADLALLPFDGLLDDSNKFLVESWHVSYLTSGRQLVEMLHWRQSDGKVIVLAEHTPPKDDRGPDPIERSKQREEVSRSGGLAREYRPLPATGLEAKAIARALPNVTQLYTGPDATKLALESLASPKLLHFAVHGYFVDGEPIKSANPNVVTFDKTKKYSFLRYGLVLNGGPGGKSADLLTSLEISLLNLKETDLVVLSACDSGIGDTTPGNNESGLRTAFGIAGAKAVISSLWTVDDVRGREFMAEFYQRLAAGNKSSINESMRQTKLSMISEGREPYYWASFVLDGKDQVLRF